ncbi:MAG: DUF692 domain-containing protein [Myxococcota bacterium]
MTDPTGVGIGLRNPHLTDLLATERSLDFLEIIPENYVGRGGPDLRTLDACRERWPLLVHGVAMSIGGPDPFDDAYVEGLRALLRRIDAPFYTDHLCYSSYGGFQSHQLLPLPQSDQAVLHAARRIRELRDRLDLPVAVENVTTYANMPGSTMTAAAFVAAVAEEADCGLLLDVNNLYVNAKNLGTDLRTDLDVLPLHRVVQLHVAGHDVRQGRWIDSHGAPVADEVAALVVEVIARVGDVPVLLERDLNLPPLAEVLDEADTLRASIAHLRSAA